MAELHQALTYLSPTNWSDIPRDEDSLASYLKPIFQASELLINSVPNPPSGTPFENAQPHFTTPNSAHSAKEIHPSAARPAPPDAEHEALQKQWGKPMKFSKKENPLDVALFKMAGHDRHGAWFARHQVLEGISFSKMKQALMREFPETLLVQGAPGAGAKRGLSAERRVERIDVDGVGRVEVYYLSAQMPSPVSPRDFLTLLMTTENGLTDKSSAGGKGGERCVPRSYMIVSRPLEHEGAPQRSSFVRGQYESVELIREIPLHVTQSSADLAEGKEVDPELNPVQWVMITRSDPAGGLPRFLIDRGTPPAMLGDITKFLDWACAYDEVPHPDSDLQLQQEKSAQATEEVTGVRPEGSAGANQTAREAPAAATEQPAQEPTAPAAEALPQDSPQQNEGGIITTVAETVNNYAPAPVAGFVNRQLGREESNATQDYSSDSDSSSTDSFLSAEDLTRMSTAPEDPIDADPVVGLPRESTENLSIASGVSASSIPRSERKKMTDNEKEILKLTKQREKLDQKLAKKREQEQNKLSKVQEKDANEQNKAREKMEKEMQKKEERHRKEIQKLESKKEREVRKQEARRKKREEQNRISVVARERDEFRGQVDLLRKETKLLQEQVEVLQRENTALASRLGKIGGPEALKGLVDESGRSRAGSGLSGKSSVSIGSGEKTG